MTWFNVDDGFYDHPKVLELMEYNGWTDALALWVLAGSWCAKQLTDGVISEAQCHRLVGGLSRHRRKKSLDLLQKVGLFFRDGENFAFKDWSDRQRTRTEVLKQRENERERKKRWREAKSLNNKKAGTRDKDVSPTVTRRGTKSGVPPFQTKPSQSKPIPVVNTGGELTPSSGEKSETLPGDFSLSPADIAYAAKWGLTGQELDLAVEKFVNHYRGTGEVREDWHASFRKWAIGEYERKSQTPTNGRGPPSGAVDNSGAAEEAKRRFREQLSKVENL